MRESAREAISRKGTRGKTPSLRRNHGLLQRPRRRLRRRHRAEGCSGAELRRDSVRQEPREQRTGRVVDEEGRWEGVGSLGTSRVRLDALDWGRRVGTAFDL